MNLAKIGAYIATKRKALGMTQLQLANKLGISDKSVSKWERGICLPDASMYMELCNALGISINEFFAGEDLVEGDIIKQSEENIINIAKSEKRKYTRLQRIFFIMSAIYFVCVCIMVFWKLMPGLNYIGPVGEFDQETIIAEAIYGEKDAMVFNYRTDDNHERIDLLLTKYQEGVLVDKTVLSSTYTKDNKQGAIVVIPDYDEYKMEVIVASKIGNNDPLVIPLLENIKDRSDYKHSIKKISESRHLTKKKEIVLAYVEFTKGKISYLSIEDIGNQQVSSENGYIYAISIVVDWA